MKSFKTILTILALTFSINAGPQSKVAIIPLIENAPASNTIHVKSNGMNIGVLIDSIYDDDEFFIEHKSFSPKGYLFRVNDSTGLLSEINMYFTTNNCTGPAYSVALYSTGTPPHTRSTGIVYASHPTHTVPVHYEAAGASSVVIKAGSSLSRSNDTCLPASYEGHAYPLLANDPAVTGVQDSYSLPITIGF